MLRRLARCERGAAAVEFAIISVVFLGLVIGLIEFGRILYIKNQLSYAADIASRTIMINTAVTEAAIETAVRDEFIAGDPTGLTVVVVPEVLGGDTFRVVTITYPVTHVIPILGSELITLDVTRRVPVG